jgi:hypothetical protein
MGSQRSALTGQLSYFPSPLSTDRKVPGSTPDGAAGSKSLEFCQKQVVIDINATDDGTAASLILPKICHYLISHVFDFMYPRMIYHRLILG